MAVVIFTSKIHIIPNRNLTIILLTVIYLQNGNVLHFEIKIRTSHCLAVKGLNNAWEKIVSHHFMNPSNSSGLKVE